MGMDLAITGLAQTATHSRTTQPSLETLIVTDMETINPELIQMLSSPIQANGMTQMATDMATTSVEPKVMLAQQHSVTAPVTDMVA